MNAYLPDRLETLFGVLLVFLGTVFVSFVFRKRRNFPRVLTWAFAATAVYLTHDLTFEAGFGFRMLSLILVLFASMKLLILAEHGRQGEEFLNLKQWFFFSLLWPGMRPKVFLQNRPLIHESERLFLKGLKNLSLSFLFVLLAIVINQQLASDQSEPLLRFLLILPFLVAISLGLHFGLFDLLTAFMNRLGFRCELLFKSPLKSLSLSEFWGRRWNVAFSEMTALSVYKPLSAFSKALALMAAFLFSGLLHEVAISLPVKMGYGLPTAYFLLHGGLVLFEKKINFSEKIAGHHHLARYWTFFWLVLPLPFLFHPPFLEGLIWPLVEA